MDNVNDLIFKANDLAKYYYKGFGNSICGCNHSIEAFSYFKENKKYEKIFNNVIFPLMKYYNSIDFSELFDRKEFYLFLLLMNY